MNEAVGTRVGPYTIIAPLGAGGMGQVYRAWDPRLSREVALKLLPPEVKEDPARRLRFLEEARAAGALNHPNILAVYDVSVSNDTPFIASELLEGRRLRDEIDRGSMPIKRLLDLAVQLAAGLRAAHDSGLAHRDLKPENVMVTRDGRVKILDFGLAKAYAAEPEPGAALEQATVTVPETILGTPHYMSPEQASGRAVDFRSDQFSVGLILYELATGVHPFRKETTVQTMSAIVEAEARPIGELNAKVPAPLRWVIERCLAKDPAERYASTADLAKDLATLQSRVAELGPDDGRRVSASGQRVRIVAAIGAVAAVIALGVAIAAWRTDDGPPRLQFRPLVTDTTFQGAPAWSPDGSTLAYVASVDGVLQIHTKSLASPRPHKVTDSRFDCTDPFWSPDGARIYYHSLARDAVSLWSISAAGGSPELVVQNAYSGTISPDGRTLVFFTEASVEQTFTGTQRSIAFAPAAGGDGQRYAQPPFDSRTFVDGALRFSPDGSKLLAWLWGWSDGGSHVPSPEFWVLPWPSGQPYKVLPALARAAPAATSFDWLPDGRRVVVALWDETTTGMHLWVADVETGESRPLTSTAGSENRPAVAPDGRRIAFSAEEIDYDLVEIPLNGSPMRELLSTSRNELDPTFTTDGSQYAYISDKGGTLQIWVRTRDGRFDQPVVGTGQFPSDTTLALGAPALSPKGDQIAYQRYAERSGYQIWISTVARAGPPVQLAPGYSFYQDAPTWSPDGSWIAFVERTRESISVLSKVRVGAYGRPEVLLRDIPTLFTRPVWSPDGRWIACDTVDGLVVVRSDGKETRPVRQEAWIVYTWSADSRAIIGLRESDKPRHYALVTVDLKTKQERVINPDLGVIPPASQAIRGLALVDKGTLATSIASARSDIWLVEGLAPPVRSWFRRFGPN
jgi:Tol biopolymer transport system component